MEKSFVKSGMVMMLALLIAKVIGACYRIPLTNALGAEGMGLYQLIYPVYALILTTSSGALPLAISVLVSENIAKGSLNENKRLIKASFYALFAIGIVLSVALVLLSGVIGSLQGVDNARLGYVAIAPSIVFVSGIAVLKGWFQGNHQMFPSALSALIEAVVKLVVGLTLAFALKGYGVVLQVAGALFGVSISEVVTFVILMIIYKKRNKLSNVRLDFDTAREEYKNILKISLPITIGSMVFPLTQFIDSFLVVNILKSSLSNSVATAYYGVFSGPVSTLINLPISLALAIGIAVVPHLSKDKEERNLKAIRLKTSTAIKVAVLIGVPFMVLFMVAPREILSFLYGRLSTNELELGAELLVISAPTVLLLAITQICTSVLQGLKDTRAPIINMAIGGSVKLITSVVLLYTLGIKGIAYAGLIAFSVTALLSLASTFRLMGKNGEIIKNSGVIVLFGGIMGICLSFAVAYSLSIIWILMIAVVSGMVYLFVIIASRVFTNDEIMSLPFGHKILKLKGKTE